VLFPRGLSGRLLKLLIYFHLVPTLRTSDALIAVPLTSWKHVFEHRNSLLVSCELVHSCMPAIQWCLL
jgi:hypothetical protein